MLAHLFRIMILQHIHGISSPLNPMHLELLPHFDGELIHLGKYISPQSKLALPDQEIRGGLKKLWISVDQNTLDSRVREEVGRSAEVLRKGRDRRVEYLRGIREKKRESSGATATSIAGDTS